MAPAPILAALLLLTVRVGVGRGVAANAPPPTTGWLRGAHATFYGGADASGTMDGACGYGNLYSQGYGSRTAALSTPLFASGSGCGQCYELRCVNSRWCNPGSPSVVVTGTNLCPPNWNLPSDNGGWCNPPRQHFDMAPPSFLILAPRVAGIVPVQFRRVPCQRSGGIRFYVQGNYYWLLLYVMNVGGSGDVGDLAVKRAGEPDCSYVPASRNWGITYQVFAALGNTRGLVVRMTSYSSPRKTIVVDDAIPAWWSTGLSYQGSNNFY